MKNYTFGFILLYIIALTSCGGINKLTSDNYANYYNTANKATTIETSIWHISDSISTLNIRFNQSDLNNEDTKGYKISYDIYDLETASLIQYNEPGINKIEINDSVLLKNNTINCQPIFLHKIYNKEYLLKLNITNSEKKSLGELSIPINKLNAFNRQNFQVKDEEGNIIYRNNMLNGEPFRIILNKNSYKELYVRYYKFKNSIALPPYSIDNHRVSKPKPDSSFTVKVTNFETNLIALNNEGIYHFQVDTNTTEGLSIYQYYNDFPLIKSPVQMLYPLRYLSTKKEYEELNESVDYKSAVDKFWITIAGNPDRAKSLIKKYYNAVKEANIFFSSYKEGWKTDRGMIYVIYGPPTTVFHNTQNETWIYGEAGSMLSLKFIFEKIENQFSDKDYILKRDPGLKASWFDAVDIWRR